MERNITIKDYRYRTVCDFEGKGMAKHSIGVGNEVDALRKNICDSCLKGIIKEGLKRLSDQDKEEILYNYIGTIINENDDSNDMLTVFLEGLSRNGLIALAKEKNIEGKIATMSSKNLIELIKAAK